MKTLQTILGSLALATTVAVPVSQSNAETLDSLVDNKTHVELMQDKKEKTDAEKIFDTYKGKIFRVNRKLVIEASNVNREDNYLFEFPEEMSEKFKKYANGDGLNALGRTKLEIAATGDGKGLLLKDVLLLSGDYFKNQDFWFDMYIDPKTNKQAIAWIAYHRETGEWENYSSYNTTTLTEISKKEYGEITKLRKDIVGKYKLKSYYALKNNGAKNPEKKQLELPKDDYETSDENELVYDKIDDETGKSTKQKVYVDFKCHAPLEVEFTDKGEMIFNGSKYKNPYKTAYDLNIADNTISYHTYLEIVKVVPEESADAMKKVHSEAKYTAVILPIFEPNGSISLEMYTQTMSFANNKVYVLEKVK